MKSWQAAIDSIAQMLDVPVALVRRVVDSRIEVLVSSNTPANPYRSGDYQAFPDSGLYCEAVIRERAELEVSDAREVDPWRDSPDMKWGLVCYLGLPILLPDGRAFGTVCVLDRHSRPFSDSQRRLLDGISQLFTDTLSHRVQMTMTSAAGRLADRTVLVVDDHELNQMVVTDLLLAARVNVDCASDGLEALRMINERHYDAVLMDIHMPVMDGLALTRRLRTEPKFDRLPIIALTAQVLDEERDATVAAGMNAHLTKPIEQAILYQTLSDMLEKSTRGYSLARLGDNVPRLRTLLNEFLRDTADALTTLRALVAAGELQQAATRVHFIRGAALYMEATALCEIAGRFEIAVRNADRMAAEQIVEEFIVELAALRDFLTTRVQRMS